MSEDTRDGAPAPRGEEKRGLRPGYIALLVAIVVVIIAIIQNWEKARLSFLWWDFEVWVWLLIAACVALGFVIGWFAHVRRARSLRKRR